MRLFVFLATALALASCGDSPATVDAGADGSTAPPVAYAAECENINAAHCLMPWPSDRFLADGNVAIDPAAMPVNDFGDVLDPALFERFDGFSPMSSMVTSFAGELDVSMLVDEDSIAASLETTSTTVIVDAETGERVAHWAEVDTWDETDPARAPLYIRPAARFEEGRRYVVGIRGLRTTDGAAVEPSAYFRALRDGGDAPDTDVESRRAHFDTDVFPLLEAAGAPRAELIEAWDFTTATGEVLWGDLIAMRDDAMAAAGDRGLGCNVTRVLDSDMGDELPSDVWRQVIGTVTVPLFGNGPTRSTADSRLNRDAAGRPLQNGTAEVPFIAQIPTSVRDQVAGGGTPARLEVYGHGLFGTRQEITYGWHRAHQQELGVVSVAVDWWGMSDDDLERITATLQNLSDLDATSERLMQAVINFLVLTRSFTGVCSELASMQVPLTAGGEAPAIDTDRAYYYGNSQGGIMGGVVAGVSTDLEAFVLGVGGMAFPMTIKRSSNWVTYGAVMAVGYTDALERDLALVMSASVWDLAHPETFTPHLLADPLPGTPAKRILMQVGIGDAQVSHASALVQARTMGLPLLSPAPAPAWGIEMATAPVDSALVVYDIPGVGPITGTRNPGGDNDTHEAVRRAASAIAQIDAFVDSGGQVTQTCDDTCNPD